MLEALKLKDYARFKEAFSKVKFTEIQQSKKLSENDFILLLFDLFRIHFDFFHLFNQKISDFSKILPSNFPTLRKSFFEFVAHFENGSYPFVNFQIVLEFEQFLFAAVKRNSQALEFIDPSDNTKIQTALQKLNSKMKVLFTNISQTESICSVLSISGFLSEDIDKKIEWKEVDWH